jgi:uncharacterized protein YabE (DUF348 family)
MENNIEKAVKPEVSKETLLEVVKELQEIIIGMIETEELELEQEDEIEVTPANPAPIGNPEEDNVNWPVSKVDGQTDLEAERKNETYKSDSPDEDKWDNDMQKCWTGYKQVGMKDKGGKMVPNCVPIEKSDVPEVKKSSWSNMFDPNKFNKRTF